MKLQTKQRIVKIGLAMLAVWPLIHIGVVHQTGISPWRGFGWGMYTQPVLDVQVGLKSLEADPGGDAPTKEQNDVLMQELKTYIRQYQALGANAKPDRVASAVLDAYPRFKLFEVNAKQFALDRKTARVVEDRSDRFTYRRDAVGQPVFVPSNAR